MVGGRPDRRGRSRRLPIIGDLNLYAKEDPIMAIKSAGYTNLIESPARGGCLFLCLRWPMGGAS